MGTILQRLSNDPEIVSTVDEMTVWACLPTGMGTSNFGQWRSFETHFPLTAGHLSIFPTRNRAKQAISAGSTPGISSNVNDMESLGSSIGRIHFGAPASLVPTMRLIVSNRSTHRT